MLQFYSLVFVLRCSILQLEVGVKGSLLKFLCHCKLTENPKNENQDTRHHHDLNIVLLHAHITWKEVRSNSKRKKSTNMERKNQKYIMCKNDKYFEQNSPRFSCKETIRESRSKELKEDDHHHSHPQRRPRVQGAPA